MFDVYSSRDGKQLQLQYLLPHLGWIAARAPNRVNRAHGPTKENRQNFQICCIFPAHAKMGPDGPKWGREEFVLLIQTLPTFWAERILILRIFIFWIFWGSQFFGLGPRGPTNLGPAWAHPLGPSVWPAKHRNMSSTSIGRE